MTWNKKHGGGRPLRRGRLRRFFAGLGPGLVTGAADDDPSGISTYSVTGAAFGYGVLWTALFSFPLMTAVQLMCARIGLVTGHGLAGVVRRRYPRWVLWGACSLLVVANVFNISADLGGMAEVTELVTGVHSMAWTPLYAAFIVSLLFWSSYRQIARVFKWLSLVLFAYVAAGFLARPDWAEVLRATLIPHVEWSSAYLTAIVGRSLAARPPGAAAAVGTDAAGAAQTQGRMEDRPGREHVAAPPALLLSARYGKPVGTLPG